MLVRFLASALSLLALPVLPAQSVKFLNGTVPNATPILWQGVPALFTVTNGGPLFTADQPRGPQLVLDVLAVGVLDSRPCAVGARWGFGWLDFQEGFAWPVPASGMSWGYSSYSVVGYAGTQPYAAWSVTYCKLGVWPCYTTCSTTIPEWSAIVYVPRIK